jgi:hypothetical protein
MSKGWLDSPLILEQKNESYIFVNQQKNSSFRQQPQRATSLLLPAYSSQSPHLPKLFIYGPFISIANPFSKAHSSLTHLLDLGIQNLFHRRPLTHPRIPRRECGKLLLHIQVWHQQAQQTIPRHPGQIGVRALVADQVLTARLL